MKKRLFGLGCVCLILMMTISSAYATNKVTSMSLSAISAYNGKTLLTIADDSASVARNNYSNANSLNEDKMHNATNVTLKRAQRDVAGVIYKFCKDTGIVS